MRKFITVKEMKDHFPFSQSQIYKMVSTAVIPYYRVMGKIVFDPEEVCTWVKNNFRENGLDDVLTKLG